MVATAHVRQVQTRGAARPALVRDGFRGRICATRATTELAGVMLLDSGYLLEEEAGTRHPVYVTHGEPAAADTLRPRNKRELHGNVRVPEHLERVPLSVPASTASPIS